MTRFLSALALAAVLVPGMAVACPNCKEAVESASVTDDDPLREAKAYNRSIYLMMGVPYLLLGSCGAYCYFATRGRKPGA